MRKPRRETLILLLLAVWFAEIAATVAQINFDPYGRGTIVEDVVRRKLLGSTLVWWALLTAALLLKWAWPRRKSQIMLAAAATLLSLATAEVALRVTMPLASLPPSVGRSSARLHHEFPPNRLMFSGYAEEAPVLVRTNEDGLRSERSRGEFLKFGQRVVVMGDSFAHGLNVRQDRAAPQRLEAILRERLKTDDLAVLNAGVPSYSPFVEKIQFERIIRAYKPTAVALLLDTTDIADDYSYSHEWDSTRFGKKPGRFINRRGRTSVYLGAVDKLVLDPFIIQPVLFPMDHFLPGVRGAYDWQSVRVELEPGVTVDRWFIYRYPLERTRPFFEATLASVRGLAADVKAAGCPFMLAVTPRYQHWNPRECLANRERRAYSDVEEYQYEYFAFFDEAAKRVDFEVFDMLPIYRATALYPLVFYDDPHWNETGCDFAARALADRLIQGGYVKAHP